MDLGHEEIGILLMKTFSRPTLTESIYMSFGKTCICLISLILLSSCYKQSNNISNNDDNRPNIPPYFLGVMLLSYNFTKETKLVIESNLQI